MFLNFNKYYELTILNMNNLSNIFINRIISIIQCSKLLKFNYINRYELFEYELLMPTNYKVHLMNYISNNRIELILQS